jgi:hypothetical protein
LADDAFSESTATDKGSGKQGGICGGSPSGLKRKEEAMTRGANPMTEKFVALKKCQDKRTERMQLERDTTTYYVCVCTLPKRTSTAYTWKPNKYAQRWKKFGNCSWMAPLVSKTSGVVCCDTIDLSQMILKKCKRIKVSVKKASPIYV